MRSNSLFSPVLGALACGLMLTLGACGADGDDTPPADDAAVDPVDAGAAIDSNLDVADAQPIGYDWSCVGDTPPGDNVPATVHVIGRTFDALADPSTLGNVAIVARNGQGDIILETQSAADGNFDLALPTGGAPIDGELQFASLGYVTTYVYPQDPIVADVQPLYTAMFSEFTRNVLEGLALTQFDPGDGLVAVSLTDCAGAAVRDAELVVDTADANTRVLYVGDNGLPDAALARTGADGTVIVMNLNPGPTVVRFRHELAPDNNALQPLEVTVYTDSISAGMIHP